MKKNTVFYKVFIPFLLLGVLLVGGFSAFIYQNTYEAIKASFINDKKSFARQIRNNIERKIRTIDYAFSTYGSTSSFEATFQQPLTAANYDVYLEIRRELSYIEMMVMDESVYSLISLAGQWGVINGSLTQLSQQQVAEYRELYIADNTSLFWQKNAAGIEMTITLPMFQTEKYAIGVATIPNHTLDQIIENDSDDPISIYNQNEIVYRSHETDKTDLLTTTVFDDLDYSEPTLVVKEGTSFILLRSDYNNWLYAIQLNESSVGAAIKNLQRGLVVVSLTLLAFIVGFAYIFSERFSRPISRIQKSLDLHSQTFKDRELDMVAQSIDKIVGENEYLSASLVSQKPQLETLFVLSLFRNRVDKREVQQRLAQFGYDLKGKRYYTGVIQIDGGERHGGEKDLLLLAINNIVAEIVPESERMLPIVLNEEMQATIFVMEQADAEASRKVMAFYQQIQGAVKEYLKVTISVGISRKYFEIRESKKAIDFAKEALYYRLNIGPESIIFYKEIEAVVGEASVIKYPVVLEEQLFDAIRSGEKEVAADLFALLDKIFEQNKNPLNLEVALVRLINELVQLGQLLGVDTQVFGSVKQLYLRALTTYQPADLKGVLLKQLVLPIVESTQARTDREFKSLSDKIIHIVQNEYDRELSLELIADRLHYNPNYLSSVFKKEYGEKFADFVQNYRLEIAKKWLRETEMTVKEIAERLQYRNPQNFIRFFKKKVSVTPGEYRKQYR